MMTAWGCKHPCACDCVGELHKENEKLKAEVDAWRSSARYDPLMEGPRFAGWNRSSLDRCRKEYIETKEVKP